MGGGDGLLLDVYRPYEISVSIRTSLAESSRELAKQDRGARLLRGRWPAVFASGLDSNRLGFNNHRFHAILRNDH